MNWFGATGLVTVAKSTLKGAQKAIDKALDIKEEEENVDRIPTPAQNKEESDSFFSTWGVKTEESPERTSNPSSQDLGSSSLWGSFTGSFFENPRPLTSPGDDSPISQQPKRSSVSRLLAAHGEELDSELSLGDDSSVWEGFSKTQLVVETCTTVKEEKSGDPPALQSSEEVKWRRKERSNEKSQNRNSNNRLSVVSSESDRRSSDSVEVIGSTSCTASPESDLPNSLSTSSLASSAGLRPVSASSPDSVDIIPESSDSHSASVEVLGSHGSSTSLYSPLDPSLDKIPSTSKELASPDSVEVVPEEEDDVSLADDSYASASASESTMTQATILEPHGQTSSAMESSTHFLESIDSAGQTDTVASRTDTSISSLVLDSSTDTIYSDHGSLGRSAMQLTLTTEYPQPSAKSSWTNLSLLSSSERSHSGSLESLATKDPANQPSKHIESNSRTFETYDTKLSSPELVPDISAEETIAGMTSTDSSGEGTLVESSSDDTIPGSDQQAHSTSGYVRNLLAEAMVDDSSQIRVNSPVSVESRSDGLRLGSEQTSGHTSGDELETTTSSDIEIISSPNGDGSSTTSRQSPAKHLHRAPHGPVDILKFSGKIKAHLPGLEFGVFPWLFIFGLLSYSSYCDACSSRSSPRQRIPPSTPRPNITELDQFYKCPPEFDEFYCLNGASCFQIQISDKSQMSYGCFCADGFLGSRCEFKALDGNYRTYLIETAGIAGGVAIAVFLSFVVCAALYVHMRRRRQRRSAEARNSSTGPRPFDKRPLQKGPESIKLTSLA